MKQNYHLPALDKTFRILCAGNEIWCTLRSGREMMEKRIYPCWNRTPAIYLYLITMHVYMTLTESDYFETVL
jgi:hypothetical protein